MHIKEICLEGFKSYATRTVVPGFDPFFNAITGLNGSGKSNILDSICFVLGITNLQQVRASNLQELVYKQGQAGITKATVSIVFDNSDRSRSPLGYEDHSEITVTRQVIRRRFLGFVRNAVQLGVVCLVVLFRLGNFARKVLFIGLVVFSNNCSCARVVWNFGAFDLSKFCQDSSFRSW